MNFGSNCAAANQDILNLQSDCSCCPIFNNDCIRYVNNSTTATTDQFTIRGITYTATIVTNYPPTDISLSGTTVVENQAINTTVGSFSTTDQSIGQQNQTFSYALVSGTGSTNNALFNISGNTLRTSAIFDYESKNSYSIRVRTTDNGTPAYSYEKVFIVNVINAQIEIIVPSGGTGFVTYNGPNGACATLAPTQGRIYMNFGSNCAAANQDILNLQNDCSCCPIFNNDCIRYTNTNLNATTDAFTIRGVTFSVSINYVNTAPTDITLGNTTVSENAAIDTPIGSFTTTDPGPNETNSYSLVSGMGSENNALFNISGNTLRTSAIFDYETKNSYSIRVRATDSGGLSYEKSFIITVTNSNELTINSSQVDVLCFGTSSGSITATPSGESGPYTYSWEPGNPTGDGTATVSNLSAGVYSLTVTATPSGFTSTRSYTITQPSALTLDGSSTDVTTYGGNDGSASVTVSGGTTPYTYNWTPDNPIGDGTATITGLRAGSYTVSVTDFNNCTASRSYTISQPAVPIPKITDFTSNSASICQGNTVELTATIGNVTGTYSFTLASSSGTPIIGAASSALLSQSVTASEAGTQSFTLTVSQSGQSTTATTGVLVEHIPIASLTNNGPISCTLSSVTLTASGGTSYTFANSNGVIGTPGSSNTVVVSSSDTYSVSVASASGCVSTTSTTVSSLTTSPTLSITPTSATLTCASPSVSLSAVGTGTYRWSTGATTQTISATSADTYSVTLTGANGCSSTASSQVSQDNDPPTLSILPASATLTCASPVVSLSAIGAGSISWSTGAATSTISVSVADTYSVTLTGTNGCTATTSAQVSEDNSVPQLSITPASTTLTCSSPAVSLSAIGSGTYQWSTGATTQTISATSAGPYSVTLTGSNGCTATASAQVSEDTNVPTLSITPSSATLTCANPSTTLTANGTGTYLWSTGATSQTIAVNTANAYSVTLTSGNGCTATQTTTIQSDTAVPTATLIASGTLSCAQTSVTLTATGGATYSFAGPGVVSQSSNQAVVNVGGLYSVTATSANGCTATQTTTVQSDTSAPSITLASSGTLNCIQTNVTLTATAGFISYAFSVSAVQQGGSSGNTAIVSSSGLFSVTVTAANGCSTVASVQVSQDNGVPALSINPNSATLTCTATSVSLSAVGTGTYRWSTGETTSAISVSTAAAYSVTLTGANGCSSTASVSVSADQTPPLVSISPSSATLTCTSPLVSLSALGNGSYRWSTGATTSSISVSTANTYSVSLTGTNGCSSTAIANVSVDQTPPLVSISPVSATLTCTTPSVSLTAVGTGTYRWSTGTTTSTISTTAAGTYSVTLTGANGCSSTATANVTADQTPPSITLSPSSATLTCTNPVASLSAVGNGTYRWSNGATTSSISVSTANAYSVTLTGANGCSSTATASVIADQTPPSVSISPTSATLTCTSPVLSLTAIGNGSVRWNNGATTSSISVSTANAYSVTLTGSNGCSSTATVSVSVDQTPPSVSISPTSATLTCTTPTVSLSANGTGSYRWNTGATSQIISVTSAGTYSVTLTGANGCSSTATTAVIYQNCAPTVANSIPPQSAVLGNPFSYTIPANTFADAETPNSLTLSVVGLPAGLSFVSPNTITGTPSTTVGSPFSVTVTATDPGGLSASTSFSLTVQPRSFAITGVTMLDCNHISYFERRINFTVSFEGTNGQLISLSVINEARTVTIHEPYQLTVYTDNPVIVFKARQQGTPGEATFSYNWLAFCANGNPRVENAIPPQSATVGQAFSYTIPANTFTDAETPTNLTLSVVGLPAGLSFVALNTITGTVSASASAFYSVTVTATDPAGGFVSTILPLSVVNPGGCGSMFTLKAGDWNDASVWSCGRVPLLTDVVTLNHAVSLPPTYQAQALRVIYSPTGRLIFGASSRLRLGGN
ncbi:cadherin domain-containing protein [Spirosoma sp. BT702]|uniref:Cadherin domain-containing protein n=1 Tax=Spirosoma profusum TaxID=2771354 RepID=A0A926Y181_9BACT|nr:putative Ig domain-containing protein [Spirosoma profusum]MBD2701643.1 cadherin domain-containing protein [Spirosoma profusum]